MVVLEHPTESFTAFNLPSDGTDTFRRLDELIAQTLMVPFGMVVLDVDTQSSLQ